MCIDEPDLSGKKFHSMEFVPGTVYKDVATRVRHLIRTKERPLGYFFEASITSHMDLNVEPGQRVEATIVAEFRERGWHYGWTGGRYKKGYKHCFEVLVFEKMPLESKFWLLATHCTPSFTVYSSRRSSPLDRIMRRKRKGGGEKLAETSGPSKRRGSNASWSSSGGSSSRSLLGSASASTSNRSLLSDTGASTRSLIGVEEKRASINTSTRSLPILRESSVEASADAAEVDGGGTKQVAADFDFFLKRMSQEKKWATVTGSRNRPRRTEFNGAHSIFVAEKRLNAYD